VILVSKAKVTRTSWISSFFVSTGIRSQGLGVPNLILQISNWKYFNSFVKTRDTLCTSWSIFTSVLRIKCWKTLYTYCNFLTCGMLCWSWVQAKIQPPPNNVASFKSRQNWPKNYVTLFQRVSILGRHDILLSAVCIRDLEKLNLIRRFWFCPNCLKKTTNYFKCVKCDPKIILYFIPRFALNPWYIQYHRKTNYNFQASCKQQCCK